MAVRFDLVDATEWPGRRAAWAELVRSVEEPNPFFTTGLLDAALDLPDPRARPSHLLVGTEGGELRFGLPLQVNRVLGRRAATAYAVPSEGVDHMVPLDATPGQAATRTLLAGEAQVGIAALAIRAAPDDLVALVRPGPRYLRRTYTCPYVRLPATDAELLAQLRPKMRQNLRRADARIAAASVTFRVLTADQPGHSMVDALGDLRRLHAQRAESTDRDSRFLGAASYEFHRRVCEGASAHPDTVWFVEALQDGAVIGSLYGFLAGPRFWDYQSGFEQSLTDLSLGTVVLHHAIQVMIDRGVAVFDLLRGTEEYKSRWVNGSTAESALIAATGPGASPVVRVLRWRRAVERYGRRVGTRHWLLGTD